jgi:ribulose-bisphosphate carboxylase small chain
VAACRKAHSKTYIRVNAFDSTRGFETTRLSFIVNRPADEPGFSLKRQEGGGRNISYTIESYAAKSPEGRRYE